MPTSMSGPPPAKGFLQAPFFRAAVEAESALDGLDLAECSVADEFDGGEVSGFVVAAIGDHELDVGRFAGLDHGFGVGD